MWLAESSQILISTLTLFNHPMYRLLVGRHIRRTLFSIGSRLGPTVSARGQPPRWNVSRMLAMGTADHPCGRDSKYLCPKHRAVGLSVRADCCIRFSNAGLYCRMNRVQARLGSLESVVIGSLAWNRAHRVFRKGGEQRVQLRFCCSVRDVEDTFSHIEARLALVWTAYSGSFVSNVTNRYFS